MQWARLRTGAMNPGDAPPAATAARPRQAAQCGT